MADPLSIIVGTVGLLDVCWRVGGYLKDVEGSAGKVDKEIAALSREITSLISLNKSIQEVKEAADKAVLGTSIDNEPLVKQLWKEVDTNIEGCRATVEKLEELLKEIIGKNGPNVVNKLDGIRKQVRRQSKDGGLAQIHYRLSKYQASLQTVLAALNVGVKRFNNSCQP